MPKCWQMEATKMEVEDYVKTKQQLELEPQQVTFAFNNIFVDYFSIKC